MLHGSVTRAGRVAGLPLGESRALHGGSSQPTFNRFPSLVWCFFSLSSSYFIWGLDLVCSALSSSMLNTVTLFSS